MTLIAIDSWCLDASYKNTSGIYWQRAPGSARILRAHRIMKPRVPLWGTVPGILANEWHPSNRSSFAVESRTIMETLWLRRIRCTHHQVSMILRRASANVDGRMQPPERNRWGGPVWPSILG